MKNWNCEVNRKICSAEKRIVFCGNKTVNISLSLLIFRAYECHNRGISPSQQAPATHHIDLVHPTTEERDAGKSYLRSPSGEWWLGLGSTKVLSRHIEVQDTRSVMVLGGLVLGWSWFVFCSNHHEVKRLCFGRFVGMYGSYDVLCRGWLWVRGAVLRSEVRGRYVLVSI